MFLVINGSIQSPFLDRIMAAATDLGLGYVQALGVLFAAMLLGLVRGECRHTRAFAGLWGAVYRRRAWVGTLLMAIVVSGLASDAIKGGFSRHRPWWFYEEEHRAGLSLSIHVRTVPGVYPLKVHGFPSGHAATSTAMATVVTALFWRRRKRRWAVGLAWLLAGVIGFSRIYLASHWPLDLLGGAAVGVAAGLLSVRWCEAWARRRTGTVQDLNQDRQARGIRDACEPIRPAGRSADQVTRSPDRPAA